MAPYANAIFGISQIRRFHDLGSIVTEMMKIFILWHLCLHLNAILVIWSFLDVTELSEIGQCSSSAQRNQQNFRLLLVFCSNASTTTCTYFFHNEFNYLQYQGFVPRF